jgi:hypothetical protein
MASSKQYNPRVHVGLLEERVTNVSSTDFPGHYPDEDHSWDLKKFKKVCNVHVLLVVPLSLGPAALRRNYKSRYKSYRSDP